MGDDTEGTRGRWRPFASGVLLALAAVLAPLAVVAGWAHDEVGDTSRYVETVAPLASDPTVQDALVARITTELFDRLDVRAVTQGAVDALEARGLPPAAASGLDALTGPLSDSVHDFVEERVRRLVRTDEFTEAWTVANREAHSQMVAVLTGETGDAVDVSEGRVRVNLAAVIETVKQQLVDNGFALAARVPPVDAEFTLLQSADLPRAQRAFRALDALARVLPWLALALLAAGVWVARSRRRALVAGSLAAAGAMALLGAGLNLFRDRYLDALPSDRISPAAAGVVYDALVHVMRVDLRVLLVLFLVLATLAWAGGTDGVDTGRFGAMVRAHRTLLRTVVLGTGVLVYVLAAHPGGAFTLAVLGCAAALLLVIELLARPATATPSR